MLSALQRSAISLQSLKRCSVKPDTSELLGRILGELTVIEKSAHRASPSGKKRPTYRCRCSCGNIIVKTSSSLRSKTGAKHCGCKTKQKLLNTIQNRDPFTVKTRWKAFSSYTHMLARCYDSREYGYEEYGGRGITVSEEWRDSFWKFLDDMGERPENHVIDRIDPNKNYYKENCRWVERSLSSFNTRKAKNNTSGRTGVYWFDRVGKWIAAIFVEKKQKHLGYFDTHESAVEARRLAELKYFGENKE